MLKKVKLHVKKKAKEAKKLGLHKKPKVNKHAEDDSPLNEEEIKALEARKAAKSLNKTEQKNPAATQERVF